MYYSSNFGLRQLRTQSGFKVQNHIENKRILLRNKYERYYGPGRRPLAYLLYYRPTVSPACA